jgi:hypothetical protein
MIKKYAMIAFKEIRNFIIIIANIADELICFRDVGEVDDV